VVVVPGLDDTELVDTGPDEEDAGAGEPAAEAAAEGVDESVTPAAAASLLLALLDEQAVSPTHAVRAAMTTTVGRASMRTSGSRVPDMARGHQPRGSVGAG
jgi:hypothetical protein